MLSIGGVNMAALRIIVTIIYVIMCITLTVIVSAGLGAISGAADTYWGKNKGRSMEGALEKGTKYLAVGFILVSILLNLNW